MKTIEEAAIEFESNNGEKIYYDNINNCPDGKLCIKSFKAGAEFAQRWIPVEEELPNTAKKDEEHEGYSDYIELRLSNLIIVTGYMFEYNNEFLCCNEDGKGTVILNSKVTHWRPIELK